MDKRITELRKIMDKIDKDIINLISRRLKTAKSIGKIKKQTSIKILDTNREKIVLDNIAKNTKKKALNEEFTKKLFKDIIKESKKVQK